MDDSNNVNNISSTPNASSPIDNNGTVNNTPEPVVNATPTVTEPVQPVEPVVTPIVVNTPEPVVNATPTVTEAVQNVVSSVTQNAQVNNTIEQPTQANTNDDTELLKAFIGKNYDKISTSPFNFAGFFLTTLYMSYRKMIGYAVLFFALNVLLVSVLKIPYVALLFNVVIALVVNKLYISFAKKKITKIKVENQQKSFDEIKGICAAKGGTSGGSLALGIVLQFVIAFVIALVLILVGVGSFITNIFKQDSALNTSSQSATGTLVENVTVGGYGCFGSACTITIGEGGNDTDYTLKTWNNELFKVLSDYADYIKINILYDQKGSEKTIVNYQIFLKSTNEDISSVKTEAELREKIGLFSIGTHTETLTLKQIGDTGFGFDNDESYTYINYIFQDKNNVEYEMKYIITEELKLTEGNEYKVTFEVSEGTFEYEYTIKSIEN